MAWTRCRSAVSCWLLHRPSGRLHRFGEARINADLIAMIVLCLKVRAAEDYARKLKEYALKHRAKNPQDIFNGQPGQTGWPLKMNSVMASGSSAPRVLLFSG